MCLLDHLGFVREDEAPIEALVNKLRGTFLVGLADADDLYVRALEHVPYSPRMGMNKADDGDSKKSHTGGCRQDSL